MPISGTKDENCKVAPGDVIEIVVTGKFSEVNGQYEPVVISKKIYKQTKVGNCLLGEMN